MDELREGHHLPECLVAIFAEERWLCICSQLWKCELRVLNLYYQQLWVELSHEEHCKAQIDTDCNCSRYEALNAINLLLQIAK